MPDERKPVICPWCGGEMELDEFSSEFWAPTYDDPDSGGDIFYRYTCQCGAFSPTGETEEAAYAAATRTPPNRPLTLPELFDLEDDDAVWVVSENGRIWAMGAEYAQEWASEEHCIFFARKPTPADIEAARKEADCK